MKTKQRASEKEIIPLERLTWNILEKKLGSTGYFYVHDLDKPIVKENINQAHHQNMIMLKKGSTTSSF